MKDGLIIMSLASAGALAVALWGMWFFLFRSRHVRGLLRGDAPEPLMRELKKFAASVASLDNSLGVLSDFTTDYFSTLETGGYTMLTTLRNGLQKALELALEWVESGEYGKAEDVLVYLSVNGGKGRAPACLRENLVHDVQYFADWKEVSRRILLGLVQSLSGSSESYKKAGRTSPTNRRPTSTVLAQLRDIVTGDL